MNRISRRDWMNGTGAVEAALPVPGSKQQELFDQKMAEYKRSFFFIGKNNNSMSKFRENVELFIDDCGEVSDGAFKIVEREMVEAGELIPYVPRNRSNYE